MAYTMQQVIDHSRLPLNDADKVRYSDADLLGYANDAVSILKIKRPDIFFGMYFAMPGPKSLSDAFPLDDSLYPIVSDYVTARAETHNDESVIEQRAVMFLGFVNGMVS